MRAETPILTARAVRPLQYAFRRMFLASSGLRGQDRCHFGHGRYRKQDKTVVCSRLEESVRFAFQDVGVLPSTGSYEPGEGEDTRSLPAGAAQSQSTA